MDPPEMLVEGALQNHYKMIKQMRGVPGVLPERFEEGFQVRHCALSLVGEPIMYPEINTFTELLHEKGISSYLVTNAQFPEEMKTLKPVTQLYISIDASTKDALKAVDRPLNRDFWERFTSCIEQLALRLERTVFRLTLGRPKDYIQVTYLNCTIHDFGLHISSFYLVKGWNAEEIDNYAKLVLMGKPDFIEVKGVTYCGTSKASKLTMENVPWHEEVIFFVQKLADQLPDYEIACEHEHSNCILISHKKFKKNGQWHTWIDYEKFQKLYKEFKASDGTKTFTALDYSVPTPAWSVFGSKERGFDPGT